MSHCCGSSSKKSKNYNKETSENAPKNIFVLGIIIVVIVGFFTLLMQ